ncbi:hypothetical protein PVAP13_3NG319696 [Panicum virgatum]|uniref:Uncharacterized protein n=1 Tax=Panicum virgatum TaxID=38727 RepID=A0A8T0UG32_PANVG|nr:hypothetical protein PVAP13_J683307 [Panicum virgatum]KAG2481489.1 hypothetical protein PVAP13_J683607 [Panicum virgatum]KAG2621510.1 hypothetical protein PVAP13_3NG319696 [Panicum virgatum]
MHELHGAAVRRLEGEHAIAEVVEQVHVLLHVVADDGRLVHRQCRARPRRGVEQHHAFRGRVHGHPVVLRRHHRAGARERGAGVDHHAAGPYPRRDLAEAERRRGDGEPGAAHAHPDQGQVVERAEGVLLGVLGERHGCHRRVAVQAGGRGDEQVARVDGVAEVGREARERAAAEPDDAGRAVQGARREPRRGDAPEREAHLLRPEREHLGSQEPHDVAGAVADGDGARPAAAERAAPGLRADDGARGAVARHGLGGARAGGVVMGEVLAEAAGAAGGALRPDEVAAGVDDGLGALRRVPDEVLGDVLRLRPADGRGHHAHGRQAAVGALDGAAHALLAGAAVLGVDVDELETEAGRGGGEPAQGGAEERETEQRLRHSYLK